ncbi:4-hydroxy-tetrahydrodipicolinate synthase [bacterium]|nr:4-hydroxy-tetrahydrodipicolinate synthase [bacterium]
MFTGSYTALVTPFTADTSAIDYASLEKLLDWQLQAKVSGFVVGGTTGESATLTKSERAEMLAFVIKFCSGKVPVIAGTGTNNTSTSIELTREAKSLGAAGALCVNPYYNKPTQEGLYQHFKTIAEQGGLPVIVYNIPGRTSVDIGIETFSRLATVPGIVAVKEASGSANKIMWLAREIGAKVNLLSGEDDLTYMLMSVGGKGVISAAANVIPQAFVTICDTALKGDLSAALNAQLKALPMIKALFLETNPAPAKRALKHLGLIAHDTLRLPLVQVSEATDKALKDLL